MYDVVINLRFPVSEEDFINISNKYNGKRILIKVPSTKGLSSNLLQHLKGNIFIRVDGPYNKKRLNIYNGVIFSDGSSSKYMYDSVIYSNIELTNILKEIENIESGIKKDYTDLEKIIYIYDYLKKDIMYDPMYESEPSSKTRTLRGLLYKQTVCAGYSLIFKELMDRQNIECEYVEGVILRNNGLSRSNRAHAWNIIKLNNKKYGIDLTWENSKYRKGDFHTFLYFGTNKKEFCLKHKPHEFEETLNYEETLSEFDKDFINKIYENIIINEEYKNTIYNIDRGNGDICTICQLGKINKNNGKTYYRYLYIDGNISSNNTPKILYSEFNMTKFIYSKVHGYGNEYTKEIQEAIAFKLFSQENINDSLNKNTCYIGTIFDKNSTLKDEIIKEYDEINLLNDEYKLFKRKDNTYFIALKDKKSNNNLYSYYIYEIILENNKYYIKSNYVSSEKDFFYDNRECIPNKLLSRNHIEEMCNSYNGYIGYCLEDDKVFLDKDVILDIKSQKEFNSKIQDYILKIPSYEDIIENYNNHSIDYENNTIKNKNNDIVSDINIIKDVLFASLWFKCANVLEFSVKEYIYSNETKDFYNKLFMLIFLSIEKNDYIDTKKIFECMMESNYFFAPLIVVNLFNDINKIEYIYKYLTGKNPSIKHEILYDLNYAYNLCNNKKSI